MNSKIVLKPLRNSYDSPSTQILIILRNFQYWFKSLVSYNKHVYRSNNCLDIVLGANYVVTYLRS